MSYVLCVLCLLLVLRKFGNQSSFHMHAVGEDKGKPAEDEGEPSMAWGTMLFAEKDRPVCHL